MGNNKLQMTNDQWQMANIHITYHNANDRGGESVLERRMK